MASGIKYTRTVCFEESRPTWVLDIAERLVGTELILPIWTSSAIDSGGVLLEIVRRTTGAIELARLVLELAWWALELDTTVRVEAWLREVLAECLAGRRCEFSVWTELAGYLPWQVLEFASNAKWCLRSS